MVFRELNFGSRSAIFFPELVAVVLVWIVCTMPLAAQSTGRTNTPAGAELGLPLGNSVPAAIIQPSGGVSRTADALIEQMSVAAGVIFAGQVTAVRRPTGFAGSGQDAAEGIVEIDLRVDQSLRGPRAGAIYTLREWSGLWAGCSARYKIGQRLLLFLYPPDAHGLSAPVHGPEGAIPLRGSGVAPGSDDATTSAAEWLVDLRWLRAQALRKRSYGLDPVQNPVRSPVRNPVRNPGDPREPITGPVSEESLAMPLRSGLGDVASGRGGEQYAGVIDPELVYANRGPWAFPAPAAIETQPLSQVLALCREAITVQAAAQQMTRRNDARQ